MRFYARIQNRALQYSNPVLLKDYLRGLKDNQILTIDIDKKKKLRSNQQNKLYWGLVLQTISLETGHNSEELHFFFKRMFLPRKYIKVGKKRLLAAPTTIKLNTQEFIDYVEKILVWSAQELGIEWNL